MITFFGNERIREGEVIGHRQAFSWHTKNNVRFNRCSKPNLNPVPPVKLHRACCVVRLDSHVAVSVTDYAGVLGFKGKHTNISGALAIITENSVHACAVEWVAFLLSVLQVPDSNPVSETGTVTGVFIFFSVPPGKF